MTDTHLREARITAYLDGEVGSEERTAIAEHLDSCAVCRAEVEAESMARDVLRWHAAAAKANGGSPPWRPRVYRLGRPPGTTSPRVMAALLIVISLAVLTTFRSRTVEAVGVIGDSSCVKEPHGPNDPEARNCTLNCVKKGAEFVLLTDNTVYRIKNQQFPNLGTYANVRITATGTVTKDVITLKRVVPAQ